MSAPTPRAILAPNPSPMTLAGTWTYIVGRERPVIIDPGPDIPRHVEAVVAALDSRRPLAIVLTHSHVDHAAAAPAMAKATGGPIWLAPGALHPSIQADQVDHAIADGDAVTTDMGVVRMLSTPGHTPDHICLIWHPDEATPAVLLAGDLLLGEGDTTFVGSPEGSVADYLQSLDRVEALGCGTCYPAHGPPFGARDGIDRHRAHRLRRLAQVRELLRQHPDADLATLVDGIYGSSLDPRLRAAASASIGAMREYLRSD